MTGENLENPAPAMLPLQQHPNLSAMMPKVTPSTTLIPTLFPFNLTLIAMKSPKKALASSLFAILARSNNIFFAKNLQYVV